VRFVISALVTRDDGKALPAFIAALREQTYRHFRVVLVDGTGEDKLRRTFEKLVAEDPRFAVVRSDDADEFAFARVMRAATLEPFRDDDVIVTLRANERLAHAAVLNRLAHVYGEHDEVWATYGTCVTEPLVPTWPQASFPPATAQARRFRALPGVIGEYAPLTMRAALANTLARRTTPADLAAADNATRLDDDADLPLFLAVLESAGPEHVYAMADVQVIKSLEKSVYKSAVARQAAISRQFELRARAPLPPMAVLDAVESLMDASSARTISGTVTATTTDTRTTDAVKWVGPVYDPSGYGNELRQFVLSLDDLGTRPTVRAAGNHSERFKQAAGARLRDRLDVMLTAQSPDDFVGVLHLPPAFLQRLPGARRMIARTMFETDGLPSALVAQCNQMDELWVPSDFNIETFRAAGVRAHMVQVPGGIDSARFHPDHRPYVIPGAHGTVFLSTIEWKTRKGWRTLLDAWIDAFSAQDDVTLVIRASIPGHTESDSAPAIWREIDAYLATRKVHRRSIANIVVLGRALGDDEVPRLYAAADAYVAASSGEGWGYPYMEAMATGLPTIATRWSGNLAFMNDANSLLCDVDGLIPAIDPYVGDLGGQRWAQPSTRHLTALLRTIVDDPARTASVAARGLEDMRTVWTWERAAAVVQDRLVELAAEHGGGHKRIASTRMSTAVDRPTTASVPVVRWEGPQFTHSSLGLVNREVCRELLQRAELELIVRPTQPHDFTPEQHDVFVPLAARIESVGTGHPLPSATVHVAHQWPPSMHPPQEGAWVLMQPWEYGGIPGEWIPLLRDQVDEYWVYCSWQRECAIESGVPADKVAIIPLGVDAARYCPDGPRYPLATRKKTKLLAVGGIIPRKGMDLLVETYLRTFSANDDVCLVIKGLSSRWAYHGNSGQTDFAALPALVAAEGAAEIEFIGDTLSDDEVASLYRACDALVAPFRGEGFGLPIAEAMASELPVIVTHAGPVFDLCDEETAYLVAAGQSAVPSSMAGAEPGILGFWWADPDTAELSRYMRHVVDHPDEARAMGKRARARILQRFTHAHTATHVTERVRVVSSRSPVRTTPSAAFTPETHPAMLDQPRQVIFFHHPWWHQGAWRDVVGAFMRTFTQADDISLVLAHDPTQGMDESRIADAIAEVREANGRREADAPDILLVPGEIDEAFIASLMAAADCVLADPLDGAAMARAAAMDIPVRSAFDELRVVYEHAHRALVADSHIVA
jgi:glycosyltransferase involved in cell wall biosynthesis